MLLHFKGGHSNIFQSAVTRSELFRRQKGADIQIRAVSYQLDGICIPGHSGDARMERVCLYFKMAAVYEGFSLKLRGLCKCHGRRLWSALYLEKSICIGGCVESSARGKITRKSLQTQAARSFPSGHSEVQGFFSETGNECKNVLCQVGVPLGSLVDHWESDWMITCYCWILMRIIKVINWLADD